MKKSNRLSLGRVNELHSDMKMMLEKKTTGVSSKFLPLYVAWFQYIHNKQIDDGRIHPARFPLLYARAQS